MDNMTTTDECKLDTSYEDVRRTLLEERYTDRLSKPLGYWVLPNDRRLPLAFLGRTLGDLLATPFDELSATPGIGEKKIGSLVKLLHRATKDQPPAVSFEASLLGDASLQGGAETNGGLKFDPSIVSEALWSQWREGVRDYEVGNEKLGRLAPSLQNLPTVIWHTPLSQYLDHTVAEIRRLRTHGEKRVRCVLEVFHSVYQTLNKAEKSDNLRRLLTPVNILQVHDWVSAQLKDPSCPAIDQLRDQFVSPLLQQLQVDSGPTVHRLAMERLGFNGEPTSVRAQARSLGVTRARVYQLLDDGGKVMNVRWPEGKRMLDELTNRLSALGDNPELRLFYGMKELCFPEKQNGIPTPIATREDAAHPTQVTPSFEAIPS
ncbi:MAG: hypothetical protein P8N76_09120 [Pirellulaceae bacterium]|nr:hypothetical protein [Pirellulaceae bacterium]